MTPADCQRRREVTLEWLGLLVMLPFVGLIQACTKKNPVSSDSDLAAADGLSSPRNTDDLIVPRSCTLGQLLDRLYPGWSRWQNAPNINGDGIWSIPGRISSGMCNILVNGTIVWGGNINVDTLQLARGDSLAIRPV